MMKWALVLVGVAALVGSVTVWAKAPKGAVRGKFTIGILASTDPLAKYMRSSAVWCKWFKEDHVLVHVNLKNTASEHVTATIKPRYYIARGGEHGSGGLGKNFGFDAGEFRSLWIDAGHPKGVPARTSISRCAPYLYLIQSG